MGVNLKCVRCGKSTRSEIKRTCDACLSPDNVKEWLFKNALKEGDCILADVQSHSDGRYRVTIRSDGGTITSTLIHKLMDRDWCLDVPANHSLAPICRSWNCLNKNHWRARPNLNPSVRARMYKDLLERVASEIDANIDFVRTKVTGLEVIREEIRDALDS